MEKPETPILPVIFILMAVLSGFAAVFCLPSIASAVLVSNAFVLIGFAQVLRYLNDSAFYARRTFEITFQQDIAKLAADPSSIDQRARVDSYDQESEAKEQTYLWVYVLISLVIVGAVVYFAAFK